MQRPNLTVVEGGMPSRDPEKRRAAVQRWRARNKDRTRDYNRRRYLAEARSKVIAAYGGACECCGETEDAFLTVEHKEGVPASHRHANGSRKSGAMLGECPHKAVRGEAA